MPTLLELYESIGGQLAPAETLGSMSGTELGPIVTDSRRVEPGCVFWALRGSSHNGSDFAENAYAHGASGVIADRELSPPAGCWGITTADTHQALCSWAAYKRRHFTGTLIAVTGSVGKTTTRQMIHTVLGTRLSGTASPRNFNNHIGLPLSLLQLEPQHDYAVVELGANRRGEIALLSNLCRPKVGVITHVGDAHLGGFGSRQAIAETKAELLTFLPPDGHAVMGDDIWLRGQAHRCRAGITWVGAGSECDLKASDLHTGGGRLTFRVADCDFEIPVWGQHHLTAALAAVAVGRLMGFDLPHIAKALAGYKPMPMRCEVIEVRGAMIINDAYNANPTSMRAALELLRDFDMPGRRIVVCGDMAELGDAAAPLHWQLGRDVVNLCGADLLIACGQYSRHVVSAARAAGMPTARAIPCVTLDDALPFLGQAIMPGDAVLVKGSRVMAMERLIDALDRFPRRRTA